MSGQDGDTGSSSRSHWQFLKAGLNCGRQDFGWSDCEVDSLERRFNGDLPNACGTEHDVISGILDHRSHRLAETVRRVQGPQQNMRIEYEPHLSVSKGFEDFRRQGRVEVVRHVQTSGKYAQPALVAACTAQRA